MVSLLEQLRYVMRDETCSACGRRMPNHPGVCTRCLNKMEIRSPLPVVQEGRFRLYAATRFCPDAKRLVYGMKFYRQPRAIRILSDVLIQYWQTLDRQGGDPNLPSLIIPIPARPGKASTIDALAKRFAGRLPAGKYAPLLSWQRQTVPQHTLWSRRERLENMAQCFTLPAERIPKRSAGPKRWILLDDITTTGITLREAAATLAPALGPDDILLGLACTYVPRATHRPGHGPGWLAESLPTDGLSKNALS